MIRRALTAALAAVAAALLCVAGSVLHAARLVAHVDGVPVWTVLSSRRSVALTSWRASLTVGDRLLFAAVAVGAAAAVLAGPALAALAGRARSAFARPPRGTE